MVPVKFSFPSLLKPKSRNEGTLIKKVLLRNLGRSGVRTKHYLEPEFRHLAAKVGLKARVFLGQLPGTPLKGS